VGYAHNWHYITFNPTDRVTATTDSIPAKLEKFCSFTEICSRSLFSANRYSNQAQHFFSKVNQETFGNWSYCEFTYGFTDSAEFRPDHKLLYCWFDNEWEIELFGGPISLAFLSNPVEATWRWAENACCLSLEACPCMWLNRGQKLLHKLRPRREPDD
jgi:hypothetical protein